jgi:hypothetical protein
MAGNFWPRSAEKRSLAFVKPSAHVCARKEEAIMQRNFAGRWEGYTEAQRLVAEGNQLIAQRIAFCTGVLWHRVVRLLKAGT